VQSGWSCHTHTVTHIYVDIRTRYRGVYMHKYICFQIHIFAITLNISIKSWCGQDRSWRRRHEEGLKSCTHISISDRCSAQCITMHTHKKYVRSTCKSSARGGALRVYTYINLLYKFNIMHIRKKYTRSPLKWSARGGAISVTKIYSLDIYKTRHTHNK